MFLSSLRLKKACFKFYKNRQYYDGLQTLYSPQGCVLNTLFHIMFCKSHAAANVLVTKCQFNSCGFLQNFELPTREQSTTDYFQLKSSTPRPLIFLYKIGVACLIDQFRYIKIQPKTIDLSTRLWEINTKFEGFIPQSLVLRAIVLS